jgi:hypothetical protein
MKVINRFRLYGRVWVESALIYLISGMVLEYMALAITFIIEV